MPRSPTISDDLASKLREQIVAGKWDEGKLPSERELSRDYQVARLTARRALKRLCAEQLIAARPGRGYELVCGAGGNDRGAAGREVLFFFLDRTGARVPDPIDAGILSGASAEARRGGLELYSTSQEPEAFKRIVSQRTGSSLRGVLLDWARPDVADYMLDSGVPFVVVEDDIEGLPVTSVVQDDAGGTRAALEHLAAHGHRRIGVVASSGCDYHIDRRLSAYREFMLRSGLGVGPELIARAPKDRNGVRTSDARAAAVRLLDLEEGRAPTAIFAASGGMVDGLLEEVQSRGLRVPQDLSLVVWGQQFVRAAGGKRSDLAHVIWDRQEMGRMAMLALEERIRVGRPERMVFRIETQVVDRGSVAAPCRR